MYSTIIKQAVIVMLLTAANAVIAISMVNILRLSGVLWSAEVSEAPRQFVLEIMHKYCKFVSL